MKTTHFIVAVSLISQQLIANFNSSSLKGTEPELKFTENKGQVNDQNFDPRPDILFSCCFNKTVCHIRNNGISYQLHAITKYKDKSDTKTHVIRKVPEETNIYRVDVFWKNCNTNFIVQTDEAYDGKDNYYLESCPDGILNVRSYKGIILKNLYPKIDLHYYGKDGQLKYDYIVSPNTDYKQIQIGINGAQAEILKDGSLVIRTPLGNISEDRPIVFQNKKRLKAKWILKNNILSFDIEGVDPRYILIIDPLVRGWGTYFGDQSDDESHACAADNSGNVYMVGATGFYFNMNNLGTTGAHQSIYGGGTWDGFLTKFDPSGNRLWCTYYGGNANENVFGCATSGSVVLICGNTDSPGGISSPGAHQVSKAASTDAFVTKFDTSGVRQWGTYYGGPAFDMANSCAIDAAGNIFVAGNSTSTSGISMAGSHQVIYGGGTYDAFLVKFNPSGVRQWATYYGGAGQERGNSVCVDPSGNILLAGFTMTATTTSVIATPGAHQTTYGAGFLVKFNTSGVRQWGTYYGSLSAGGEISSCATDNSGNIYIAGTGGGASMTIISTPGAHQTIAGGQSDAYLAKFDANGVRQWGTYYGDIQDETGAVCVTDGSGNVYIAGDCQPGTSTNAIATPGSHQTTHNGTYNAFVAQFNSSGVRQWGTYYGGSGWDYGYGCSANYLGDLFLCGKANSNSGDIGTYNSFQPNKIGGTYDGFLVKFCVGPPMPGPISGSTLVCEGTSAIYSVSPVAGATSYSWAVSPFWGSWGSTTNTIMVSPNFGGPIYVSAVNACAKSPSTSLYVYSIPSPTVSVSTSDSIICGQPIQGSATISATGANTFTWNTGSTSSTIVVSPSVTTVYSVTGTDANGCSHTTSFTQTVTSCISVAEINKDDLELQVFPNPSYGNITILVDSGEKTLNAELYNTLGKLVMKQEIKSKNTQLDISELASGVYLLYISSDSSEMAKRKIIKE